MPDFPTSLAVSLKAERTSDVLRRAAITVERAKETINISKEVLRVSREIEADRQGDRRRKATKRAR